MVPALRSGRDVKGALIGTGVCASRGMERTHPEGIEAGIEAAVSVSLRRRLTP